MVALGLKSNETVGLTLAEYFGTDDPQFPVHAAHRRVMQGEIVTIAQRWQGREFESRMQPLRDDAGERVIGCLGITQDVTDRNQAARSTPDYRAQIQTGSERPPDYVLHIDRSRTITFIEAATSDYDPNRVIGTKVAQWLRPETMPIVEQAIQRTFDKLKPQQIEIPALTLNQLDRWYDVRLRPIMAGGKAETLAAIVYDITERKLVELRLREQVQLLAQLLARIPRAVFWRDRDGAYLGCNEPFAKFVGLSNPEEVIGRQDSELPVSEALRDWLRQHDREVIEQAQSVLDVEQTVTRYDGKEVILLTSKVPLRDASGKTVGILGTFADVTQSRRTTAALHDAREELQCRVDERTAELTVANAQLHQEQQRLQSILDNTTAVVFIKDAEGRYTLINSQFSRIFQRTAEEILGKTDSDIFPAEIADRLRENDLRVQAERKPIQFEEIVLHYDGPHHYVSVKFPFANEPAGPCSVCGIATDISDRKGSEERLKSEEQFLRQLLELREREQMLLAYDIHDGLVQDIVAAKMVLEGRGGDRADGALLDAGSYRQVLGLLVEAIEEGRRMISELRPPILDEQGIIGSIDYLVAEHLQKSGRRIRFTHQVQFDRLSPLLEQTVFRIAQEALNNFVRHSSAVEAEVALRQEGRRIYLKIRDHGVGFNPQSVPQDRFGLRGIAERARLFGGTAKIESRLGEGTRVAVELPIDQPGRE